MRAVMEVEKLVDPDAHRIYVRALSAASSHRAAEWKELLAALGYVDEEE